MPNPLAALIFHFRHYDGTVTEHEVLPGGDVEIPEGVTHVVLPPASAAETALMNSGAEATMPAPARISTPTDLTASPDAPATEAERAANPSMSQTGSNDSTEHAAPGVEGPVL